MSGVKISQLPAIPSSAFSDVGPFVQGGVTYQASLTQIATLFGFSGGILSLASGGTSASLTASNGGIFYSTSTAGAILSGTATASQMLQSGSSGAPAWSTSTWPATTTINQLLYSSSNNVIGEITAGNNGVLVSSSGGVPSWNTSLGQGLVVSSSVLSVGGANNIPFNTGHGLQDNNGNSLLLFTVTGSAVNYINFQNNIANSAPSITSAGSDTHIDLNLGAKGSGSIVLNSPLKFNPTTSGIVGTTTNDDTTAGKVGEFITSNIPDGTPVGLTNNTNANVTSIALTAGDWDVWGNVDFQGDNTTTVTYLIGGINTISATRPDSSFSSSSTFPAGSTNFATGRVAFTVPQQRLSLSGNQTVYLVAFALFGVATCSVSGNLSARRRR